MSNPQREELLRRIDPIAEFQKYSGRVPVKPTISVDGWHSVHSIDREDAHASAAINIGPEEIVAWLKSKRQAATKTPDGGAAT